MSSYDTNISQSELFKTGIACAAITPGLRSILIFDAPYTGLAVSASMLSLMIESATGQKVEQARLGVSELDDDLWGSLVLPATDGDAPTVWHRGALTEVWDDSIVRLVVIPDLTKLSLAAARACVMLIGADVAHLERHGRQEKWHPNICWIAGCTKSEVGYISPHLLDRFALRLNWLVEDQLDKETVLLDQLKKGRSPEKTIEISFSITLQEQVRRAAQQWAYPTKAAIKSIIEHSNKFRLEHPRREIALTRIACAIARLEGIGQITPVNVETAASLIGLIDAQELVDETPQPQQENALPDTKSQVPETPSLNEAASEDSNRLPISSEFVEVQENLYRANDDQLLEEIPLPADISTNPYPEDDAPVEREIASLRLPFPRYAVAQSGRGTIIGIERATALRDIAIVSTLFAAAPFQPIRRKHQAVDNHHLLLSATDLRSYRRSPLAEQMLLLLLDYTSLEQSNWKEALKPYWGWAYAERASISIVQVGVARAASDELRAARVSARSFLVPSIDAALEAKKGKATPLAHGLDLALHLLHHALGHGRSTVKRVLFIVVSDGRGNVPLWASHKGYITGSITREGIDDAMVAAQRVRGFKSVQAILLNPQPEQYPELPHILAESLGAEMVYIQRIADVEA